MCSRQRHFLKLNDHVIMPKYLHVYLFAKLIDFKAISKILTKIKKKS